MHIAWVSDFDIKGSGYRNISVPLCEGLAQRGHDIKVAALNYMGQEHNYSFSMIPSRNLKDSFAIIHNLHNLWGIDALVVAMDVPYQEIILRNIIPNRAYKYVGIMPIEADPLCQSWAMSLMLMDDRLFISQFGVDEAKKQNVSGHHLQVGIDTVAWKQSTPEDKKQVRTSLGIDEDDFVILTVADNQERKNLAAGMIAFNEFRKIHPKSKYVLVTREHNQVGWRLRDLAAQLGFSDKIIIFERGMSFGQLWAVYASADVFFLPSKTEGLGMPLLEAMAVGIPCVSTNCSAIAELLADGRGLLIDWVKTSDIPPYTYIDPFGNGNRYFIDLNKALSALELVYSNPKKSSKIVTKAREYVENRNWDSAIDTIENTIENIMSGENKNGETKPKEEPEITIRSAVQYGSDASKVLKE